MLRKSKPEFIKFLGGRKLAAGLVAVAFPGVATAAAPIRPLQISADALVTPTAQHATQVEPDTAAWGSKVVAAFQVGRFQDGGASAIGFATSPNAGRTWTSGFLPALTTATPPAGTALRATDPAVAYDAAHERWLVESLTLSADSSAVVVSGSPDGLTWEPPSTAISLPYGGGGDEEGGTQLDKSWIACDNGARSRFRGRCYVAYTDFTAPGNAIGVQSSDDGGRTWSKEVFVGISTDVPGVQPVVRPNGQLVLVYIDGPGWIFAVHSNDGGATFVGREVVSRALAHQRRFSPDTLRVFPLPSAGVDAGGRVYVAWPDCRFRRACGANDIVVARSKTSGWSGPVRIAVPGVRTDADHVLPGLGVDERTRGGRAHLAVTFYSQRSAACATATCMLDVRIATSLDGGAHWRRPVRLNARGMPLSWLARTISGYMVGDYVGTSFAAGRAVAVYALARAPRGDRLDESIHAVAQLVR